MKVWKQCRCALDKPIHHELCPECVLRLNKQLYNNKQVAFGMPWIGTGESKLQDECNNLAARAQIYRSALEAIAHRLVFSASDEAKKALNDAEDLTGRG
jgi:uncharacterized protein YlaI